MSDAVIQDTLVRMVVPMRREFGATLDVTRMRRDLSYAHGVIARALHSSDERLRRYATLIDRQLLGIDASALQQPAPVAAQTDRLGKARVAANALLDAIGPQGEALAIRIENAADNDAFGKAVVAAATLIAHSRGITAAREYAERVGPDLTAS